MTEQEKLGLLEETFDMNPGELKPDEELNSLYSWDSMTKLSLIVLLDDEFGKQLKGDDIKKFVTVRDILNFMG